MSFPNFDAVKGLFTVDIDASAKVMIGRLARNDNEAKKWGKNATNDLISLVLPFFPESISESKDVHYETVTVPGAKIPVYVWTASGERRISFSVYLAQEMKEEAFPDVAKSLTNESDVFKEDMIYNRKIADIVEWLRECMEPVYAEEGVEGNIRIQKAIAPPTLYLGFIKGGKAVSCVRFIDFGSDEVTREGLGPMYCIMNSLSVDWLAFFPDGTPRLAKVDLEFVEVGRI